MEGKIIMPTLHDARARPDFWSVSKNAASVIFMESDGEKYKKPSAECRQLFLERQTHTHPAS
jgi:hypothetical protein